MRFYRWFRQGNLPVPASHLPSGSIMVDVPSSSLAAAWLDGRDDARNCTMRAVICVKRRSDLPEKAGWWASVALS
jgi:hypothetical protein